MIFLGLMNIVALILCIIVLATCNHQAQASSHVFLGKKNDKSSVEGLCASSVTIHGYKCEEHEVRIIYMCNKITRKIFMNILEQIELSTIEY